MSLAAGPNPYEIHFDLIGPLQIIYYHPKSKVEGVCHLCGSPVRFEWTVDECKQSILRHIWDWHSDQPKPQSNDKLPMPGR